METYGIVPPPVKAGVLRSTIDTIEPGRFNKGVSSRMERLLRGDHLYALKRVTYNMRFLGMRDWLLCGGINVTDMCSKALFDISILHRATRVFMRNDED
jgi:hypothetical protein